jgi:hypothetical protein
MVVAHSYSLSCGRRPFATKENAMTVQLPQCDDIERTRYYQQLDRLWRHVRAHLGEDIHKRIASFLFREDFLSADQRAEAKFSLVQGKALNAVRLDNQDIVPFPPFPTPDIPDSMRVSLTRIE